LKNDPKPPILNQEEENYLEKAGSPRREENIKTVK
jgi:hypothetical protein